MRVIAGSARGRQLAAFSGKGIRPTPDRVREALFSILFSLRGSIAGCSVLDLYTGSGALGIEALSRGAKHAWFVDCSRQAMTVVKENLERCGFSGRATMLGQEVSKALPAVAGQGPFNLIFADPPYGQELVPALLDECSRYSLLAPDGVLVAETAGADRVPEKAGNLVCFDRRRYGLTMLHFFQPADEEPV